MASLSVRSTSFGRIFSKQFTRTFMVAGNLCNDSDQTSDQQFDAKMLEYIVCPLSKKPLRYSKETNELICDELQVAYPIKNGIPNLVPGDARKLDSPENKSDG